MCLRTVATAPCEGKVRPQSGAHTTVYHLVCCTPAQPFDEAAVDAATATVWRQVWPAQRLRQREFFSFGMEVLLKLDLQVSVCGLSAAENGPPELTTQTAVL